MWFFYQNHIYGRSKWKTLMENCWMWMCNFTELLCLQKFEIMLIFFAIATQCIFREIARLWIAHIYCIVSSIWSGAGDPGGLGGRAPPRIQDLCSKFFENCQNWIYPIIRAPPWVKSVPPPLYMMKLYFTRYKNSIETTNSITSSYISIHF